MINGNAVGGIVGYGKTFILTDENGNEVVGTVVEDLTVFDADPIVDIRTGKKAVTDAGIVTGSAIIPDYATYAGKKYVTSGSNFQITFSNDMYDYTELQCIICIFNSSINNSVAAEQVVIGDYVYNVKSDTVVATISKDVENKTVNLNLINTSGAPCIIRYFAYKELY